MVDLSLIATPLFLTFCRPCAGIVFAAYAPIGSPGRFFKQDGEPDVMEDPIIKETAGKYNIIPAQV